LVRYTFLERSGLDRDRFCIVFTLFRQNVCQLRIIASFGSRRFGMQARGHLPICSKLHVSGCFEWRLPFEGLLKEDFETEKPKICRQREFLSQTFVCETRLI
jgi:hypothetical protein